MRKMLTVAMLLALAGSAMAGFSIGFKPLGLPNMVSSMSSEPYSTTSVPMLRVGWSASEDFRIELLGGYDKWTWEDEANDADASGSTFGIGGSAFYVIASPANTVCSMGASFVYSTASGETNGNDGPSTTGISIYPILRVDFAIPGAERFALFTEFGARYMSATTDNDGNDLKYTDFGVWGSEQILGGAYYSF